MPPQLCGLDAKLGLQSRPVACILFRHGDKRSQAHGSDAEGGTLETMRVLTPVISQLRRIEQAHVKIKRREKILQQIQCKCKIAAGKGDDMGVIQYGHAGQVIKWRRHGPILTHDVQFSPFVL